MKSYILPLSVLLLTLVGCNQSTEPVRESNSPPVAPKSKLEGEDNRRYGAPPAPEKPKNPPFIPNPDTFVQATLRPQWFAASPEFREPTEQEVAAVALGRIGRAAVPALLQSLRHRDPQVRKQSAEVLARIGPDAVEAVPELTAALDDADPSVRKAAARALGQIGPPAAKAVPALMRTLVEPHPAPPQR